jgi:hypothetical protein
MGINTRIGKATPKTSAPLVITWSSNAPTPALTQTIANGTVPTVAELGQAVANFERIITRMSTDLTALYAQVNAGE